MDIAKIILSGFVMYLSCLTVHIVWAEYPLLNSIREWIRSKVTFIILNPVIDCPVCMTLFWGLVFFGVKVTLAGVGIAVLLESWRRSSERQ